jgi:Cu-Zn family superoxide dismutase
MRLLAVGGVAIAVMCVGATKAWAQFPEARAILTSCATPGLVVGSATLIETPSPEAIKNVTVMVSAGGLSPGKHAVQIHEVGACTPTCAVAGSHLDLGPFGNNIPVTANHPYHSGDLINLSINSLGRGSMSHVTSRFTLSPGHLSIFDADGAAIVIHALPDLYCADNTDPNCAGGGRVACGVLQRTQ